VKTPRVALLIGALLATSTAPGCEGKNKGPAAAAEAAFPPIFGKTLGGEYLHVADLGAKAVLVNVWATWCGPCRKELPTLERVYRAYRDRGLVVLGVSVDGARDRDAVARMVERAGLSYPVILDPSAKVTTVLDVSGYPASFLFDAHGRLVWRRDGIIFEQDSDLDSQLAALLATGPASAAQP